MRTFLPALIVTALLALIAVASASASVVVNVRIEGPGETLFEGPVRTEGHMLKAASETTSHPCDGTNGHHNPTPGATPTAAGADAMSIAGEKEGFDGIWEEGFHDFKITRWGPDAASTLKSEFWGLLIDQTFTSFGGCQIELAEGDQVLWMYDGFANRPFLTLFAGGEPSGAAVATATVALGQPLTVTVGQYTSEEGAHHGLKPYENGAEVSPVSTAANGFQTVESSALATTEPDGTATVTFKEPGWHRLKASPKKPSEGFRSNRLDVCVPPEGASDCGALPSDDLTRSPPVEEVTPEVTPEATGTPTGSVAVLGSGPSAPAVLTPAPPLLRLDGLELAPIDDRARGLVYRGRWRRVSEARAWLGTVSLGSAGATLSVHLAAGRPVLILRDVRHRARLAVLAGTHRQIITVAASSSASSRAIVLPRRRSAGAIQLRILKGTVGIDGVAVTP
jgi:hypothetical protein